MGATLVMLSVAQGSCAFLKALYFSTWAQQDHFSFSPALGRIMVLIYVSGILLEVKYATSRYDSPKYDLPCSLSSSSAHHMHQIQQKTLSPGHSKATKWKDFVLK